MKLKANNIVRIMYKLWIAFTVMTCDLVKSLHNSRGPNNKSFVHGTNSLMYSTNGPFKSSLATHTTDFPFRELATSKSPQVSKPVIRSVLYEREMVAQDERSSHYNLGKSGKLINSTSTTLRKELGSNEFVDDEEEIIKTGSNSQENGQLQEASRRAYISLPYAPLREETHHQLYPLNKDAEPSLNPLKEPSIILQSLQNSTRYQDLYTPTQVTPTSLSPKQEIFCTTNRTNETDKNCTTVQNTKENASNIGFPVKTEKYLSDHNSEQLQYPADNYTTEETRMTEKLEEKVSTSLLQSNIYLTDQQDEIEHNSLAGDDERGDYKNQEVLSQDPLWKSESTKSTFSQEAHILFTSTNYYNTISLSEGRVSRHLVERSFDASTTQMSKTDTDANCKVHCAENNENSTPISKYIVKHNMSSHNSPHGAHENVITNSSYQRGSTKNNNNSQAIAVPFIINDNTKSADQRETITNASTNSSQSQLQTPMYSDNQEVLIGQFKLKYPVKLWKSLGLMQDKYLDKINPHWMKYEPPSIVVHKIFAVLYGIFMIVGCGGNFLVIFMFSRILGGKRKVWGFVPSSS